VKLNLLKRTHRVPRPSLLSAHPKYMKHARTLCTVSGGSLYSSPTRQPAQPFAGLVCAAALFIPSSTQTHADTLAHTEGVYMKWTLESLLWNNQINGTPLPTPPLRYINGQPKWKGKQHAHTNTWITTCWGRPPWQKCVIKLEGVVGFCFLNFPPCAPLYLFPN